MKRRGQAIVFTLLFLIPMIVALGLLMRVDSTINMKIRVQSATDAAAQEGGAQVARVLNQIAVHNMSILKYHALQAATKTALQAANATKLEAQTELNLARKELQCWQSGPVPNWTQCCNDPFCIDPQKCPKMNASNECVKCLTKQVQTWQKIVDFWTKEEEFFQKQSDDFKSKLGDDLCKKLGNKSDSMVQQLDKRLKDVYDALGKEHRLHLNTPENRAWINNVKEDRPLQDGQFRADKVFKKGDLKNYTDIAMTAKRNGENQTDRGVFNFEGPPPDVTGQMADKKKDGKGVNPTWGPTRYYMEYIYSVHIGLPGYFNFGTMHGPLGNPDTRNSSCGGGDHPGCEHQEPEYEQAKMSCGNPKPCHRDRKDYTAEFFHREAEKILDNMNKQEFSSTDHIIYELADTPQLEFIVNGRIEADQGFFNRLFKARTVDMPDDGPRDANNNYLRALAKFELYNLTETNGQILSRKDYGKYSKSLLTQDWNAIMTPIVKDEIRNERKIIQDNMVH